MSLAPGGVRAERIGVAVVVLAVLWQLAPLYRMPFASQAIVGTDSYRSHDWQEVAKLDLYARRALLEWGRFPLWNPLVAGGTPQLAHPSDGSAGPLILSSLLLGETLGMKVNVGLVLLAGALGLFFLLRRTLGVSVAAATVAAVAYAWSGWLPSRVAVGFYESCLMVAWPAVLALWLAPGELRARRRRWVAGALVVWALAIQLQLALPVLVLLMAVLWAATAAQARVEGRPFSRGLALGGLAVIGLAGALGAVKFVPMIDLLGRGDFRAAAVYPTHPDAWYRGFDQLWYGLFHHVPPVPILDADGGPRIQEYVTLQPGLGALALAGVGLVATVRGGLRHAALPFVVAGGLFLWLGFGPWAPVDAFRALHGLLLFSSMRGPLRYFNYPLLLTLCVLVGVGFAALEPWLRARPWLPAGAAALALLLCLPSALDSRDLLRTSFLYSAAPLPAAAPWRSEGLRTRSTGRAHTLNLRKYSNIRRGVPTVYVPEDIPIEVAATPAVWVEPDGSLTPDPAWRGEAFLTDRGAGQVSVVAWRAQELVTAHSLQRPARVVLNQNHWEGWTCGESAVVEYQGLLAFEAPAGQGLQTTCRWRQPGLRLGAAISLLGVAGLLVLWPWRRPKPGRRGV